MTTPRQNDPVKKDYIRHNDFLKYLQKRMKELEKEEKKFREIAGKTKKAN